MVANLSKFLGMVHFVIVNIRNHERIEGSYDSVVDNRCRPRTILDNEGESDGSHPSCGNQFPRGRR